VRQLAFGDRARLDDRSLHSAVVTHAIPTESAHLDRVGSVVAWVRRVVLAFAVIVVLAAVAVPSAHRPLLAPAGLSRL
jgi:hypothetical protein